MSQQGKVVVHEAFIDTTNTLISKSRRGLRELSIFSSIDILIDLAPPALVAFPEATLPRKRLVEVLPLRRRADPANPWIP